MLVGAGRVRGVLDEGAHAAGHEARGPDRGAGPGHLADLDHAAAVGDLHAPPRAGRRHLVGDGSLAGVDHDLDAITLHGRPPAGATRAWAWAGTQARSVLIRRE